MGSARGSLVFGLPAGFSTWFNVTSGDAEAVVWVFAGGIALLLPIITYFIMRLYVWWCGVIPRPHGDDDWGDRC